MKIDPPFQGDRYIGSFLHDAVYAYLLAVNETITDGKDWKDGRVIAEKARGLSFDGKNLRSIVLDIVYWVLWWKLR